jgi:hypothetical protein
VKPFAVIVALLAVAWWWKRNSSATPKGSSNAVQVPDGATIGQIGSNIENPAAVEDFAEALRVSAQPRIVNVESRGTNWLRWVWSDGRVTITDGTGNAILDNRFTP